MIILDWLNKIVSRWRQRKWDKRSRIRATKNKKRIEKILRQVLKESHARLDQSYKEWLTADILDRLCETEDKQEISAIFAEWAKKCRQLIRLPLLSNLENVKIKEKE